MTTFSQDPFAPAPVLGAVPSTVEQRPDDSEPGETHDVPDGTVPEVLAWVDGDPERAGQALYVEGQKDRPRVTLVEALEDVLTAPAPEDDSAEGDDTADDDEAEQGEPDL